MPTHRDPDHKPAARIGAEEPEKKGNQIVHINQQGVLDEQNAVQEAGQHSGKAGQIETGRAGRETKSQTLIRNEETEQTKRRSSAGWDGRHRRRPEMVWFADLFGKCVLSTTR